MCPVCFTITPLKKLIIITKTNKFVCKQCFIAHVSNWLLQPINYNLRCPVTNIRIDSNSYNHLMPLFLKDNWTKKQQKIKHIRRMHWIYYTQQCTWNVLFLYSIFCICKGLIHMFIMVKNKNFSFFNLLKGFDVFDWLGNNLLLWYGVEKLLDRYVTNQNWKTHDEKLLNNIRQCRICRQKIEKKNGCKHINCICGHEFCWDCGLDWKRQTLFDSILYSLCTATTKPCPNTYYRQQLNFYKTFIVVYKIYKHVNQFFSLC